MPAGDEDEVLIVNPLDVPVTLVARIGRPAPGQCRDGVDPAILIHDGAGAFLAYADDTFDFCPMARVEVPAGASRYVIAVSSVDNDAIEGYVMAIHLSPGATACGDGLVGLRDPLTWCDDGNALSGDLCEPTCSFSSPPVDEVEPNEDGSVDVNGDDLRGNDFSMASAQGPFTDDVVIRAAINVPGDEDVFHFRNISETSRYVVFRVHDDSVDLACNFDSVLVLHNESGSERRIVDGNLGYPCSDLVEPLGPGESVYAHVLSFGDDFPEERYHLVVDFDPEP